MLYLYGIFYTPIQPVVTVNDQKQKRWVKGFDTPRSLNTGRYSSSGVERSTADSVVRTAVAAVTKMV